MTKGARNQNFTWGNGLLSASGKDNADSFHYLQDHLGSPIRLLGGDDTDTALAYDEFGVPTVEASGNMHNPFGFTGYQTDYVSGMDYAQARYYDSGLGRFGAEDLIKDGLNWYAYCHNDPIGYFDPTGLIECDGGAGRYAIPNNSRPATRAVLNTRESVESARDERNSGHNINSNAPSTNTTSTGFPTMTRDRDADVSAIVAHVGSTDFGARDFEIMVVSGLQGVGAQGIKAGEAFFGAGEAIVQGVIDLDAAIGRFIRENRELGGLAHAGVGIYYLKKGAFVTTGGVAVTYGTAGIGAPVGFAAIAFGSYYLSYGTKYLFDGISMFVDAIQERFNSDSSYSCPATD